MEHAEAAKKTSFLRQVAGLPANFWFANIMEMLERLSFFGVRAIAPLFLVAKSGENGLGLDFAEKGLIYTVWALLQCLIPMVSGGYTERYGYRKSLVVAFLINIIGYILMAQSKPLADYFAAQGYEAGGFWVFMAAACFVATGTAIFKPPVQGTVAASTNEETSSMGWGLFYWVVNIGGALAPMGAAILRADIDWPNVFYAAAIVTTLNFVPALFLYREPEKKKTDKDDEADKRGPVGVFVHSIAAIFTDLRLVVFLLIFACFWLMFMQLWDLLPNFIDEWVDSSDVAPYFGWVSEGWVAADGRTKPEMIINLDSIAIILLVIPLSWLISRMHKVAAMIIGMVIALVGFVGAGYTAIGWLCCLMIFVFSIGEMACSPTFSAYIGLIAPKGKKALYMGYSNIPFAIGWALGNLVGGYFYNSYGARDALALKHLGTDVQLTATAARVTDWSDTLEKLPPLLEIERNEAFETLGEELSMDRAALIEVLHERFRHDHGQIDNLALQYYALRPENREKVIAGLARGIAADAQTLVATTGAFGAQVKAAVAKPESDIGDASSLSSSQPTSTIAEVATEKREINLSAADKVYTQADGIKEQVALVVPLARGEVTLEEFGVGQYVHLLPRALGVQRGSVLVKIYEIVNPEQTEPEEIQGMAEITAMLWREHGQDEHVLDNLALEYLAQGTDRVREAVAAREFEHEEKDLAGRGAEVTDWTGIDRGKAFAALSVAMARRDLVDADLLALLAPDGDDARVYSALAGDSLHLSRAVSSHDWRRDLPFLIELIENDEAAREIVSAEIDEENWMERLVAYISQVFSGDQVADHVIKDGIDYTRLSGKKDLIEKALRKKDWNADSESAGRLLGLNGFEARALLVHDEKATRKVLWDAYDPFMVWVYLGAIGLGGTAGMIVFYLVTRKVTGATGDGGEAAAA